MSLVSVGKFCAQSGVPRRRILMMLGETPELLGRPRRQGGVGTQDGEGTG